MADKVTVIVPVYNVEKYLDQCVKSVIDQTYKDLQIVLVDDGSPDRCPQMCDEYQKKDPRISVIHKENGGLGLARNAGLKVAKGKYVIFIDSDDWLDPDYVEIQVRAMQKNQVDLLVHGYRNCDVNGKELKEVHMRQIGVITDVIHDVLHPTLAPADQIPADVMFPIGTPFKMYRTNLIIDNGLQFNDERKCIAEDVFFNVEYMRLCNSAIFLDYCGYNYRMNASSISHAYKPTRVDGTLEYYKTLKETCEKYPNVMDGIEHRIQRNYIGKCRAALRLIEASDIPYRKKISEVKKLLDHPYTIEALSEFPIQNYSKSLQVIAKLMKSGMYRLTLLIFTGRRIYRSE